ncbi:putative signal transducing protein [Ancylomarina longa]|uniref:DUF2007 domain-containing protein n=1 Tax=Ancylomarina longa TaxID=2487017 RepID=A0A434ATK5_9BACT|nr:DUF2007 domain-containing protein [Ancylomarina longa]RUT77660.1 DUF2007 domain-containing protein [Ancylomarina longa]
MTNNNEIACVFVGSFIDVQYYKERLEEIGISSLTKDEFSSGMIVGMGGIPDSIELFVEESDLEKAKKIIRNIRNEEN